MKNTFLRILLAATAVLAIASCNNRIEPGDVPVTGFYVVNNGNWGANDANILLWNSTDKTFAPELFLARNSIRLGDLAQDMLCFDHHRYIAVNGSQVVFVTDDDLNVVKKVVAKDGETTLSPRYLVNGGSKVYVTYYEGYLGEIDPANDWSVRVTKVGPNPDGLAYVGGKIYVANSGGYLPGYCDELSIVDASSFKEVNTIKVNTNPYLVKAAGDYLYILSRGNYYDIPAKVQCLDLRTNTLSDLSYTNAADIALCKDRLYVLCAGYDAEWKPLPGSVYVHDAATNTEKGKLVTDGTEMPNAFSISAVGKFVFVGCSDYVTNGDVYAFTAEDGKLYEKFDSQGLNPIHVSE